MDDEIESIENNVATAAEDPAPATGIRAMLGTTSWDVVALHITKQYIDNPDEKARRAEAKKRDDLYENCGDEHLLALIDTAFEDETVKKLRAQLVAWAKWNNVVGRIVREKATVYSQPAVRRIANDDERYQKFIRACGMDAAMRELNRKLVLHEDVWVQYRVRQTPRGRQPVVDVISPASIWAVAHPRDATLLIAIVLDQTGGDPSLLDSTAPAYRVWTDAETFMLDAKGRFISGSLEPWALGRMPGMLATTRPASTKGRLLAKAPSADLVAAHTVVWFLNLLLLKESKSSNKQTYVSGDVSNHHGQTADSETEVVLPEGVNVQAIDRGMDLAQFRETSSQVLDDSAANHGVPPSVRRHEDASSGAELHLRRIPLHELRVEQIPVMREVEFELATVQSGVNSLEHADGGVELAEYAFDMDGWGVDFGEIQQPATESEADATFEKRRQLGLTDTVEEMMKRNPDLATPEAAKQRIELYIARETARVAEMRTLQALNGSVSSDPTEPTPEQNGEAGREAARDTDDE